MIHETDPDFAMVPFSVLATDEIKDDGAVRLYCVLLGYAMRKGECHPSLSRLARNCGCTVKSVTRRLAKLEDAGWIDREQRTKAKGGNDSTRYRLHLDVSVELVDKRGTPASVLTPASQGSTDAGVPTVLTPASHEEYQLTPPPSKKTTLADRERLIVKLWKDIASRHGLKIPRTTPTGLLQSGALRGKIKSFLSREKDRDLEAYFRVLEREVIKDWHRGDNPDAWRAGIEWAVRPSIDAKVAAAYESGDTVNDEAQQEHDANFLNFLKGL